MSSSNATSVSLISLLNSASNILNGYLSIFIFIFGVVGNLLNVLVLSQRALRVNPSAVFFNVASIAGLIVILSGLISRTMSGYSLDLTLTIGWLCKLRNVILYGSRTIVLWLIVLATVDRWLSSSTNANNRRLSNLKNVWRSMLAVLIYTCLINAPIIFYYEANLTGVLRGCYGSSVSCRLATDLTYAFGSIILPLLFMLIFGLLTIRNVRHIQRRVRAVTGIVASRENKIDPANSIQQTQTKKTDRNLLKMLLAQIILLCLFMCPHAIQKVYSSFTPSPPAQSLQSAVQNLLFNAFTLFTFIASGMPFYIYTLCGGSVFRNTLSDLIKTIVRKILCH